MVRRQLAALKTVLASKFTFASAGLNNERYKALVFFHGRDTRITNEAVPVPAFSPLAKTCVFIVPLVP